MMNFDKIKFKTNSLATTNHLKHEVHLINTQLSPQSTENTVRLHYRHRPVDAVWENNPDLLRQ
jgi:hypothetical protein